MLPTWTSRRSARYVMVSSAAVGEATPFWFDVAEEANWIDSVAKLDQTYGAVNVLVNNAAMFARLALETLSVED